MEHSHDRDVSAAIDPVCGMTVDPVTAAAHRTHGASEQWFCSTSCADRFDQEPDRYLTNPVEHSLSNPTRKRPLTP
jgi:YHS domain-containing protein